MPRRAEFCRETKLSCFAIKESYLIGRLGRAIVVDQAVVGIKNFSRAMAPLELPAPGFGQWHALPQLLTSSKVYDRVDIGDSRLHGLNAPSLSPL